MEIKNMTREQLIANLRTDFVVNIRELKLKDKCEYCGSDENLEVHHKKSFADLLDETLIMLGLDIHLKEIDSDKYELIKYVMRGKQLTSSYLTLCPNCHKQVHELGHYKARRLRNTRLEARCRANKEELELYLDSIVDKKLYKEQQEELINRINLRVNGRQQRAISKMNKGLEMLGLNYIIISKKSGSTRCWIVNKIEELEQAG